MKLDDTQLVYWLVLLHPFLTSPYAHFEYLYYCAKLRQYGSLSWGTVLTVYVHFYILFGIFSQDLWRIPPTTRGEPISDLWLWLSYGHRLTGAGYFVHPPMSFYGGG